MKQKILELLSQRQGTFISGEELSNMLNISRTAVWKHIHSLKEEGYRILASPRRGYVLTERPDILTETEIRSGLETRVFGQKVAFFPLLDSTNEEAKRLAAAGAPEGTVVVSEQQQQGKGRIGRQWASPPKIGLWFTLILRPAVLPVHAAQLTFVSAVAVCLALKEATGLPLTLKWPNDLLWDGKKVGGILTELSAEIEKINFIIVGIGINVNQKEEDWPSELRNMAVSLQIAAGRTFHRAAILQVILAKYEELYHNYLQNGFAPILQAWRELNSTLGQEVVVKSPEGSFVGRAEDVNADGCLLVRKASGELETVIVGDVSIRVK
ncbi:MAG: biotin--[acetyl-CoA-carboxylase] ligase [Peptococcia bacterium]|jgi:BirA family biotin operon repressor/biotin-[acetyl-CoA-carboxylase] ligase